MSKLTTDARKALATVLGRNERTLRRWEADGLDLSDSDAIQRHIALLQEDVNEEATLQFIKITSRDPEPPIYVEVEDEGPASVYDLKEKKLRAETRLKEAQAEKAELLLEETKGNLIRIDELEEINLFIGGKVKAQLAKFEAELPPQLEGLPASKMVPIIREQVDKVLAFLAGEMGS